jgi:CBS domain containing-hemolysin-like protein
MQRAVIWLVVVILLLVVFGSVLAIAETSVSRMSRARAMALRDEGHRNAALLEGIETNPAPYLNSVYFAVMCVQNGSAILVAILAQRYFEDVGIVLLSVGFTLAYFVVVEAMAKTFGILHSAQAALALAPLVWLLGRALSLPTRVLIGLANVLLPGKGLEQGPFVSEEEIRSMADVGHEEGVLERHETDLIHSVFEFGDTVVREVMVPRPDIVAIEVGKPLRAVQELVLQHGRSRIPVFRGEIDRIEGIIHAKDVLKALHQGRHDAPLTELCRPARFVPGSKRVAELLREMQQQKFHMAIVTDEYGSVAGLVTLEDLLEELVGEIADEHDRDEPQIQPVGDNVYRASGRLSIEELNELLDVNLPNEEWDTVGGLMLGLLGAIPREGQEVQCGDLRFTAEKVHGLRVDTVLIKHARDGMSAG